VIIGYYHFRHTILDNSFGLPSITLEPKSIDLGDISATDDVHREIIVKNTGWRSLILERVQPSCSSCLIIQSFTKEPILPGKQGKIEISLDYSKRSGKVETSFAVFSNAKSQKAVVVKVTANILIENNSRMNFVSEIGR
jgi:gamma-glutamyl phosphate reductase